jgi:hypothetical protein
MPNEGAPVQEQKYYEKLNISVLSISRIKELLKDDIKSTIISWAQGRNVDRQCYRIIGPAGVGKTQICYQIASELSEEVGKKFHIIMIKAPVLSRDDFIIPFPVMDNGNARFKMLYSDFVPEGEDTFGLFVIDECGRGDHALQQLLWQVQNEYAIHRYEFPKHWFVISIDNPDDSEYTMDIIEDAAGLRRNLHIYTEVSAKDFLDYAISHDFHSFVIEYIQTHPERVYDFQSQKVGAVYANPASWEKISDHLWKMEIAHGKIDFNKFEPKCSGLINTNQTRMFLEFARDKRDINPKDIFYNYTKVEPQIKELVSSNDNSKLGELMTSFGTFMVTTMPQYHSDNLKNVIEFLLLMPVDTAALFMSQIDQYERSSKAFQYMTKLHVILTQKSNRYKKGFYDPLVGIGLE